MKNTYIFKKCFAYIVMVSILAVSLPATVFANSAQMNWIGTTSTGAIMTDGTCPIVVEKEVLTFDIQEFPKQHYKDIAEYLSYSGKVTAEYTFYNPADCTVSATLVFPFGAVPDYGYLYDTQAETRILNADTEKYDININGEPVEKKLRHTLTYFGSQFELSKDMALLHDEFMEDDFYYPNMPVTRYTYIPEGVDTETYDAANAAFVLSADAAKTRVLMENQNGGKLLDNAVQLEGWVKSGEFIVNVIGEPLSQMPQWKFYENGACENEIEGSMVLKDMEVTTLKDFALIAYDKNSGVSEADWYNAIIESIKNMEWSNGAISASDFQFDVSDHLMRWYEYVMTLDGGERIVNTVTAPIYPSFDMNYEPTIYEYTYLLSPAKSWKSFGTLDIVVNTPYYMTESGLEGFERTEMGYSCHLTGLPEGELTFTLCSQSEAKAPAFYNNEVQILVIVLGIGVFAAIAVLFIRRKRRN